MRLSDEQELEVRLILAQRIQRLRKEPIHRTSDAYLDAWNEAIEEAVQEVMGSGPLDLGVCRSPDGCINGHTYKPGCRFRSRAPMIQADGCGEEEQGMPIPRPRGTQWGKTRKGTHKRVEDIPLPPEPEEDDPWA